MIHICTKCHSRCEPDAVACDKCGAFSISHLTAEEARQSFQEDFSSPCSTCGHIYAGMASLVYRRSAKMVFALGFALSFLFAMAQAAIWALFIHRGIPLFLFFLIASLPMAVCFPIGMNIEKHRKFSCDKCGAENIR